MFWSKKNKEKNHLPKSFLFATSDDSRRGYFHIQSFDLNLWYKNEREIHIDLGLRIEFNDISKFLDNTRNYEVKIFTPFPIHGEVSDYFDSLKNADFVQLLFNASYKETVDISASTNSNQNADAKFIKFLSDEDDFVLVPYTIKKETSNNELTLEFSGKKHIDQTKLEPLLTPKAQHSEKVSFDFEIADTNGKKQISLENKDIEQFKNSFIKSTKSHINSRCSLYFRFSYDTINKESSNIENLSNLLSKQVFFDLRVNERRQNTTHSFTVDKADFIRVNQLRAFIILPNHYQLSTPATSKITRYIRTLEKSEWEKYFEFIKQVKETLFVYYWKYTFENPSNSSYSMLASFNAKHTKRSEFLYYLVIAILYFVVAYVMSRIFSFFTTEGHHLLIEFVSALVWVGVIKLYNTITKNKLD